MEVWKDVVGYEGVYMVSNLGNVKSLNWRGLGIERNLYLKNHNKGYLQVELASGGIKKMYMVHRLVASAFIENPNNLPQVNHKDEDKKNNKVDNLEWCDQQYNTLYSLRLHENVSSGKRIPKRRNSKYTRNDFKVSQLTMDGKLIKEWESPRQVFVETGMSDWSISECCRGNRNKAYGFLWRYSTNYSGRETAL